MNVAFIGKCKVSSCQNPFHAKGYCNSHYAKYRRWGISLKCPNDRRGKSEGSKKSLTYRVPIGHIPWNKGIHHLQGEKHPNWKGGITPMNKRIRESVEYTLWRTAVFERDHYTCIWCGDNRGHNLEADHIKPFSLYPELRFAIDNGRTLCHKCHQTTETYGNHRRKK